MRIEGKPNILPSGSTTSGNPIVNSGIAKIGDNPKNPHRGEKTNKKGAKPPGD